MLLTSLLFSGVSCKIDEFQCDNGQCVSYRAPCNCHKNCDDGSDEADCGDSLVMCDSGYNVHCIPLYLLCTGERRCLNASIESHCPQTAICGTCGDGSAYSCWHRCNCYEDCSDGSDEANCDGDPVNKRWMCADGGCVNLNERCDGRARCEDGSDEEHCEGLAIVSGLTKQELSSLKCNEIHLLIIGDLIL